MRLKALRTICLLALLALTLGAQAEKKPKMQTVYIFGFSMSFSDSVAYVTDVQQLDSAYVMPNGFLVGRSMYSMQLDDFMTNKRQLTQRTNAVYFDVKKEKAIRKLERLKRAQMKSGHVVLKVLPKEEFRFTAEAYEEPLEAVTEEEEGTANE